MKKFIHPLTNAARSHIAKLERHLGTYKRMNDATREALGADAEGKGTVESIEALKADNGRLREVAIDYRKHIDDDCATSGCLCTFPSKPACSAWITKILEGES